MDTTIFNNWESGMDSDGIRRCGWFLERYIWLVVTARTKKI
jgi:hypothetical protein